MACWHGRGWQKKQVATGILPHHLCYHSYQCGWQERQARTWKSQDSRYPYHGLPVIFREVRCGVSTLLAVSDVTSTTPTSPSKPSATTQKLSYSRESQRPVLHAFFLTTVGKTAYQDTPIVELWNSLYEKRLLKYGNNDDETKLN